MQVPRAIRIMQNGRGTYRVLRIVRLCTRARLFIRLLACNAYILGLIAVALGPRAHLSPRPPGSRGKRIAGRNRWRILWYTCAKGTCTRVRAGREKVGYV